MTYVLILLVQIGGTATALTAQEFTSADTCKAALSAAKAEFDGMVSPRAYGVCVKK